MTLTSDNPGYKTRPTLISLRSIGNNGAFNKGYDSTSITGTISSNARLSITNQEKLYDYSEKKDQDVEGNDNHENTKSRGIKQYSGMLLTLAASICSSFSTLLVKILSGYGVDQYGASFWRFFGITIPTIPIITYYWFSAKNEKGGSIFTTVWPPFNNGNWKTWIGLFSRGLIGSTAVIMRYYSMQYLDIGDTSVISYSTPVLVTVMAHFCLGEKCGVIPVLVAFTTLVGVVIVAKPPLLTGTGEFDQGRLIGTLLACGALFCTSLIWIITRKIREVHFAIMMIVFGSIGLGQSGLMALTLGHLSLPTALPDALLTSGLVFLSFIAQMAIVLALKSEQAGPVALLKNCDIVFGFLLQFVFLGVVPDVWSFVGGGIIFGGVIVIALRKWVISLPDNSWIKQRQGWFLNWVAL